MNGMVWSKYIAEQWSESRPRSGDTYHDLCEGVMRDAVERLAPNDATDITRCDDEELCPLVLPQEALEGDALILRCVGRQGDRGVQKGTELLWRYREDQAKAAGVQRLVGVAVALDVVGGTREPLQREGLDRLHATQ